MDQLDKKILNLVQHDFPLATHPFRSLSKTAGIPEHKFISRLKKMRTGRLIRRLGATLNTQRLGFSSTLVALHVPKHKLNKTARLINAYGNVTHNYLRDHYYNVWFTFTGKTRAEVLKVINRIKKQTCLNDFLELPAQRVFKRKVVFKF